MMWRERYRLYVHGSISKEFLERGKYTLVVFNDIDKLASSAHMQEGATTQPVIWTQINSYWHVTTHTQPHHDLEIRGPDGSPQNIRIRGFRMGCFQNRRVGTSHWPKGSP
jgi:hypothetical protein